MNRILGLALLAVATTTAAADGPRVGQWEYTQEMTIPGSALPEGMQMPKLPEGVQLPPGMSMPQMGQHGMTQTMSFQHCVTSEDIVPMNSDDASKCKMTKMKRSGNNFEWAAECQTPDGVATSEGSGTYTDDRMDATITSKMNMHGKPMEMKQTLHGRYLGPCPKQ
ncbi:DUF3617 domain-containing protein [Sinimarinibacterium sp. CAU 1509]|uniref:DUF3617 domain-containing protein n=1 Tax=Sinimarinibacterium sp. CAU 1509 TaxID=2562283 RepID=UPI00146B7D6D|nr:DUF3617 family protein [Sinimarinibacterium sp. CAU 1509]